MQCMLPCSPPCIIKQQWPCMDIRVSAAETARAYANKSKRLAIVAETVLTDVRPCPWLLNFLACHESNQMVAVHQRIMSLAW